MAGILNLQVAPPPATRPPGRPPLSAEVLAARQRAKARKLVMQTIAETSNPVDQAVAVLRNGSLCAGLTGFALGAFAPLSSYSIIHHEVAARPAEWALVAFALVFSSTSIFYWARHAWGNWYQALGLVVVVEGTMTCVSLRWLSLAALGISMLLNAVKTAVTLQSSALKHGGGDNEDEAA